MRWTVGLLSVLLLVVGLGGPSGGQSVADTLFIVKKTTAPSNVEIAVQIAQETPSDGQRVVISRDDAFADALASGVLQRGASLLLVPSGGPVPSIVADQITASGASEVVILGGTAAVSQAVEDELTGMGLATSRRAGGSRFETAIAIADADATQADTVLLARAFASEGATDPSQAFADTLAAGGLAAREGWPILLTQTDALTEPTRAYLAQRQPDRVLVMGGTAAVSEAVVAEVAALGPTVKRVAGASRAETAIEIAKVGGAQTAADADRVVLVQGQGQDAWAGGFAAASHAAAFDAPVVLALGDPQAAAFAGVGALPPATEAFLAGGIGGDPATAPVLTCVVVPAVCEEARVAAGLPPFGVTDLISATPAGNAGNGLSGRAVVSVSADGRFVAFESDASDLVQGDTNGERDVFVADRQSGTVQRVSVTSDGTQADGPSGHPSISADGRYVAFQSFADNLVDGDSILDDVFVHDRETGETIWASPLPAGADPVRNTGSGDRPHLSADGGTVVYVSNSLNDHYDAPPGGFLVVARDLVAGTTELVSVAHDGDVPRNSQVSTEAASCRFPEVSANGSVVVFDCTADNLVPDDTNDARDVFVRDRVAGTTLRVSVAGDGAESTGGGDRPAISDDGRQVSFSTTASLTPADTNISLDVYLHDLDEGTTTLVSVAVDGTSASAEFDHDLSGDGTRVAFWSAGVDLVPNDTNINDDLFVRDLTSGRTLMASIDDAGTQPGGHVHLGGTTPGLNVDGTVLAFSSRSDGLAANDSNNDYDVFVREFLPAFPSTVGQPPPMPQPVIPTS